MAIAGTMIGVWQSLLYGYRAGLEGPMVLQLIADTARQIGR